MGNTNLDGITFRDAVATDRAAIEALSDLTAREHRTRLPDEFWSDEPPHKAWMDYQFGPRFDEKAVPFARMIVACADDRVVGHVFLLFNFADSGAQGRDLLCHIQDISVLPDLRNKGIGTGLMAHAQAVMREEQATKMKAYVWKDNAASHKLFQAAAFTPAATLYTSRLAPPMPSQANPRGDARPSSAQGSSWWLIVLAVIVAVLAWAEWGPG